MVQPSASTNVHTNGNLTRSGDAVQADVVISKSIRATSPEPAQHIVKLFHQRGTAVAYLKEVETEVKGIAQVLGDLDGFKRNPRLHQALMTKANQQIAVLSCKLEGVGYDGEDAQPFNELKDKIMQQLNSFDVSA